MKSVLLSIAYFPPISWIAVALQSESIILETQETYPKQTFRNRCNIAASSGVLSLTIPVKRVNGNHTKTFDIQIDNSKNWQLLHWRSIITAYNQSPYFLYYRDIFEPIFLKKRERLFDFNLELLNGMLKALKVKTLEINYTTEFEKKSASIDLRNSFHPKYHQHREISYLLPRYIQTFEVNHGFIPDLSIIDLLFNLGPEALKYLENVAFSLEERINAQ